MQFCIPDSVFQILSYPVHVVCISPDLCLSSFISSSPNILDSLQNLSKIILRTCIYIFIGHLTTQKPIYCVIKLHLFAVYSLDLR